MGVEAYRRCEGLVREEALVDAVQWEAPERTKIAAQRSSQVHRPSSVQILHSSSQLTAQHSTTLTRLTILDAQLRLMPQLLDNVVHATDENHASYRRQRS